MITVIVDEVGRMDGQIITREGVRNLVKRVGQRGHFNTNTRNLGRQATIPRVFSLLWANWWKSQTEK